MARITVIIVFALLLLAFMYFHDRRHAGSSNGYWNILIMIGFVAVLGLTLIAGISENLFNVKNLNFIPIIILGVCVLGLVYKLFHIVFFDHDNHPQP